MCAKGVARRPGVADQLTRVTDGARRRTGREDLERVPVRDRPELREWLGSHHQSSPGIWLVTNKKSTGLPSPSYDDVVEEALCHGWIDSTTRTVDDEKVELLLTPRKPTSTWSASNKRRIERLSASGAMTPAGLAAVEVARQNGSWWLLDAVERLEIPADLAVALAAMPPAAANFDGFTPSVRKQILWWVISAKRPQTRERRINDTVASAVEGRRPANI